MLDGQIMSNTEEDAAFSDGKEVSSFLTPEFVAVVKLENEDLADDESSEIDKNEPTLKQTPYWDEQDYMPCGTDGQPASNGERIHIKAEDDPMSVENKTSSSNTFELVSVVKVENEAKSDDKTNSTAELKQSAKLTSNSKKRVSEIYLTDSKSGVNAEDPGASVGNESPSLNIFNSTADVKKENECSSDEETDMASSFVDVIDASHPREIKTERLNMNPDAFSSVEHVSSNLSSSPVAESNILIKKEEDIDADDEVFEAIVESNYRLPSAEEELVKREEEPMTSYDQADAVPTRGFYGDGFEDSSEVVGDRPSHQSQNHRDYFFSDGFKLSRVSVVLENLSSHSVQKRFLCKHCPCRFKHKHHMRFHLKKHTQMQEDIFSCTFCHLKFSQNVSLKRHLRIHLNDKPFPCQYCSKKFSRRDTLESHLKIHTNAQPFLCRQCGAKFKQKRYLRHHLTTHSNKKPFHCTLCPAKFSRNIGLKRHLRGHNNEKPFSCRLCPSKFTRKDALQSHLKIHCLQKLSCAHCGAEFYQKRPLRVHLRTCKLEIVRK